MSLGQNQTGHSQGFQAVQPIKAVGSQPLDPVVVQVPVGKTEMVSGGAGDPFLWSEHPVS